MPKFSLDYLNNESSYLTPQLESIFWGVINSTSLPYNEIRLALLDEDYAWGMHCNLNVAAIDLGFGWEATAKASTEFLNSKFAVDVSTNPLWWNAYVHVERPPLGQVGWLDEN